MKKTLYPKRMMLNNFIPVKAYTIHLIVLVGVAFLLAVSCDDFFERDLEGKQVNIVSPVDSLKTQYTTQNFWWEKMDGALTYNLQIASPSFDNIEKLLMDTNVSVTKFVFSLYPGKFQWRICPLNGSSKGEYIIRTLEIDTTLDLRGQDMVLKNPSADFATNGKSIKFSWDNLYNAEDYRFEIRVKEWAGSKVISPVLTMNDTITIAMESLPDDVYFWGVQAQNGGSATVYSTRKFYIDRVAPKAPVLNEPKDSTTISAWPNTLKWTDAPDTGSPVYDSLIIATDVNFKAGSIKFSQKITGQTESVDLTDKGKFYWKVITVDAAGNTSNPSQTNLIIVGSSNGTSD